MMQTLFAIFKICQTYSLRVLVLHTVRLQSDVSYFLSSDRYTHIEPNHVTNVL